MFLDQGITLGQLGHFLLWTISGNTVGGTVFVGVLNYGQPIKSGAPGEIDVDLESLGKE